MQDLGKKGVRCIAMDYFRSIGTYSKYANFVRCPNPCGKETSFINFLYEYCKKEKNKPVLFPTGDEYSFALSKYKKRLMDVSIPCVSDFETTKLLIYKREFCKKFQNKEYLIPKTYDISKLNKTYDKIFPIVAKPNFKIIATDKDMRYLNKNIERLRLTVLNNKKELKLFINKEKEFIDFLVFQEYIEGMSDSMYTVGIYANKDSNILGLFTGRKIRGFPADIGDCIVGENHSIPKYVINNTIKIINDLSYKGIAEFEYKKDINTKKFKLIEINVRSWSWIGITSACGVNLPWIAFKDSSGYKVKYTKSNLKNGSVKYIKITQDFLNCIFRYKYNYPKWKMSFAMWKNSIKAEKIVYAEFNANDWLVSFIALFENFNKAIKLLICKTK